MKSSSSFNIPIEVFLEIQLFLNSIVDAVNHSKEVV
jgi:hypothetical protein